MLWHSVLCVTKYQCDSSEAAGSHIFLLQGLKLGVGGGVDGFQLQIDFFKYATSSSHVLSLLISPMLSLIKCSDQFPNQTWNQQEAEQSQTTAKSLTELNSNEVLSPPLRKLWAQSGWRSEFSAVVPCGWAWPGWVLLAASHLVLSLIGIHCLFHPFPGRQKKKSWWRNWVRQLE